MATLDVTDYGATPDDSSDNDKGPIEDAFADATAGDTVYLPAGTYHIDTDSTIDPESDDRWGVHLDRSALSTGDLTVKGDGEETVIYMRSVDNTGYSAFKISVESGFSNLTVTDLKVDGNKANLSGDSGNCMQISGQHTDGTSDILIENVWAVDGTGSCFQTQAKGVTHNYCTAKGAGGYHGFAHGHQSDSGQTNYIRNSYATGSSIYGIDANDGDVVIEDTVLESNGHGAKNTANTNSCVWRRVRFKNNSSNGFTRNDTDTNVGTQSFEFYDCIAEGNGGYGYRFGGLDDTNGNGTDYTLGDSNTEIHAYANNESTGTANVKFADDASATASTIQSCDSVNEEGLDSNCDSASVDTYIHSGNAKGAIEDSVNLTIGTQKNQACGTIDVVPTASEVGAGSVSSTSDPFEIVADSNLAFSAIDGSHVLRDPAGHGWSLLHSQPGDGLDHYFSKGESARVYCRTDTNAEQQRIVFGIDHWEQDKYFGRLHFATGDLDMYKVTSGTGSFLSSGNSVSWATDTWYEVRIDWHDGTGTEPDNEIVLTVTEESTGNHVGTVSANDSDHAGASGLGVGGINDSATYYFDLFEKTDLENF